MTRNFDNAIPTLIQECEQFTDFKESVESACVVRDLKGRVRLVVRPSLPYTLNLTDLEQNLKQKLDGWFEGPILNANSSVGAEKKLASEILNRATNWPSGWPLTYLDAIGSTIKISNFWRGYQRVLSKQAWLDQSPEIRSPWPLSSKTPAIIAFYSFKGGVGRSTLLGIMALQLAKAQKKVVCIDLDLEAPGLGSMFHVDTNESPAVIDYILNHAIANSEDESNPVITKHVRGIEVGIVPAGQMNRSYIEKLGRLDYLGVTAGQSPVSGALKSLLKQVRRKNPSLDYILLDCRAGIHDIGGLSLTGIAHVNVLVGRDTPQGRTGLALTLEILGSRRSEEEQRVLIAQTMVPLPLHDQTAKATKDRFRLEMYEACKATIYEPIPIICLS